MDYARSEGGILMPVTNLAVGGRFQIEHRRDGELLSFEESANLVTNEGLNSLLGIMFHGDAQISTWYLGIFEGNYTPVATVTAATITSASTESTAYNEATRPVYNEGAAAGQSITNSANKATFTMNATKTIYGAFLVSASAKSATTGVLFAASKFATSKAVNSGDELLVTYTLNAQSV